MLLDIKKYNMHVQMLEIINILLYTAIIIASTLIGLIVYKQFIIGLVGFLIGILVGYLVYAVGQLKVDEHKYRIDIYIKLMNDGNNMSIMGIDK